MPRLFLVLVLSAAIAPGVLVRDPAPAPISGPVVRFTPLAHPRRLDGANGLSLVGAWRVDSDDPEFGGYSALLVRRDGRLAAFSDRGASLEFSPPGSGDGHPPRLRALAGGRRGPSKRDRDCEAVTIDPASGTIWAAYEQSNAIVRLRPDLAEDGIVHPLAMHGWPANRGPEAMVRLTDGRFVVLGERQDGDGRNPGLLFRGDPVARFPPDRFAYRPPPGYRPTDIAQLPDGRVLILERRLDFPLRFSAALAVADPAAIRPGRTWRRRELARIASPLPSDNFEGMAVAAAPGGAVTIWLISDDNQAQLVQRTLLLKLSWTPRRTTGAR